MLILNIFLEPRKHRVDLRNKYEIYKILFKFILLQ